MHAVAKSDKKSDEKCIDNFHIVRVGAWKKLQYSVTNTLGQKFSLVDLVIWWVFSKKELK